jgi:hypothetical protein
MVRGQVTPNMTSAEVQIHAEQVGAAGRAILSPARYSSRLVPPGVHAVRPKSGIAAMAESSASSLPGLSDLQLRSSMPPVVVVTTERAISYEQVSELSARGSDTSIPTRGWASAAGSVQEEATFPLRERNMNCHLCYIPGHFLMDCPLLGIEIKQAAIRQREAQQRDAPVVRGNVPDTPFPSSPQVKTMPTAPPRYGDFRRCSAAVHALEHVQPPLADIKGA